ncbi:MAG: NAD(P)-binding protein [Candidatus Calescibacterium sp.]|nr:NAD(P)-binding protein [Candidatus Calescibacterium sp.]MDW8195648.1 NAD(P)-binding protein [Candidatus Calescibacterium sp.]
MSIAIIGAGITGLTLANLLKNQKVVVFEENEIGGKIRTKHYTYRDKSYFIELGPDSLVFDSEKLKLIEEYFPKIFENKNFVRKNRIHIYGFGKIYPVPLNALEFLLSGFLSPLQKINFILNFFFKRKIDYRNYLTLYDYAVNRFGEDFSKRIIFPLFETVFGIDSKRLVLKFVYPFLKRFEERIYYEPFPMFNTSTGLSSIISRLSEGIKILKEKVEFIYPDGSEFIINHKYRFKKIVFTGESKNIIALLRKMVDYDENIEIACKELSKLNYRSSFIHIFILRHEIPLKSNGIIFVDGDFINSITFFSKKWYDGADIEILRVFSKNDSIDGVFRELSDLFKKINYDLESNIIEHFSISWHSSLIDYDSNYMEFLISSKDYLQKLERKGIYIFGSFLGGSGIVDRMIFVLKNFQKILV